MINAVMHANMIQLTPCRLKTSELSSSVIPVAVTPVTVSPVAVTPTDTAITNGNHSMRGYWLVLVILLITILTGCASSSNSTNPSNSDAVSEAGLENELGQSTDTHQDSDQGNAKATPPPSKPFEIETLYALLVAEFAGNRQRYDISLGNYMQEAERTRDPGVTARATRIARFLGADQAMVKMATLWADIEPENTEALFLAITSLSKSGRLTEAFEHAEQLQQLSERSLFTSIAANASQVTDIQREQLLAQFDELLINQPNNVQLHVGKGILLEQQKKLPEALEVTQHALTLDSENIQGAIQEARLLYQLEQPKLALSRLTALLQKNPENQRLRLQYARLVANDDMEEAQKQFELLAEQSPNDADILFSLGLVAHERGDNATAEKSFSRLLRLNQRKDSAHYYLGLINEANENLDQAISHYQQVAKGQDQLPALNRIINIYAKLNQLDIITDTMTQARQKFSAQATQLYLMEAQALARYDYLDRAESTLNQGLNDFSDNANLLYTRAMVKEQQGRHQDAEKDFRAVLKYQPNNASALNALGYGLADRGEKLNEALKLITQALAIRPDDPAIIDSMGWVQFRLGNFEEALIHLHQAYKSYPDHEIAAHLGEVLWVTGNQDEARKIWREGIELNPNGKIIPETMQRLSVN